MIFQGIQTSIALPRGAKGLSAVCDCGISWSYSFTIFANEAYGFVIFQWGSGPPVPHHSGSEHVKLVLEAYCCCIFRLFVWTYAIKALLLFSSFVGSLYFRRIIYSRLFRGHNNCLWTMWSRLNISPNIDIVFVFFSNSGHWMQQTYYR